MSELIYKLQSLDFTEHEAKVFIALLQGTLMSASEIAENAKIGRTDVYKTLKVFVEKGYCNEIETNSILQYELIEPDIIIDKIERNINKAREQKVARLKETFKELKPLHRTKESTKSKIVNVELIRGFNKHREAKFLDLFKNAKEEILFMVRLEHWVSDEIDQTAQKFFKKGGRIRSIYETSPNFRIKVNNIWTKGTIDDLIRACERFESLGEEVKLSTEQLPNITIFDKEIVFMNINDKTIPKHNEADIIVKNKDFAKSMILVFESFWEKAKTTKEFKITNYN